MSRMLPQYTTVTFNDIWEDVDSFKDDYNDNGIPALISDDSATTLYYLLYARYGNNPIANRDETQFKYKMFSIIYQYGPTWEKKLEIQAALRDLSVNYADIDDRTKPSVFWGSKAIYNQALNPSTTPSTGALEELTFINQQNTTNYKKGPLDGYAMLIDLLEDDVTETFLKKFNICFKRFVSSEVPLLYVTEEDEEDGN